MLYLDSLLYQILYEVETWYKILLLGFLVLLFIWKTSTHPFFIYLVNQKLRKPVLGTNLALAFGVIGVALNLLVMGVNDGLMPVTFHGLHHGVPILEAEKHMPAIDDTKLLFLSDYIPVDNRWLNNPVTPEMVRKFFNVVGYGPGGKYYVSIGDVIIWSSAVFTMSLLFMWLITIFYYSIRSAMALWVVKTP